MTTMLKLILSIIGLITIAMVFPFIREVYDFAENNGTGAGTGILYYIGGAATGGTETNNALLTFLPIGIPVILFISIMIYAIVGQNKGERGN